MPRKFYPMCGDCGTRLYGKRVINKMGAITVSLGTCDFCGKADVGIIPARDFAYTVAGVGEWD